MAAWPTVTVRMSPWLLRDLHRYCADTGRNLSALVRTAVEAEIARDPIGTTRPTSDGDPDWGGHVTGSEDVVFTTEDLVSTIPSEHPDSP